MSTNGHKPSFLDWLLGRAPACDGHRDDRLDRYSDAAGQVAEKADVIARALRTMDRHELPRRAPGSCSEKGAAP